MPIRTSWLEQVDSALSPIERATLAINASPKDYAVLAEMMAETYKIYQRHGKEKHLLDAVYTMATQLLESPEHADESIRYAVYAMSGL